MGSGITHPLDTLDAPVPPAWSTPEDQAAVEQRVRHYLHALGVVAGPEVEILVQQVLKRVELQATVAQLGEPLEIAIEETHRLLDRWLIAELGLEAEPDRLAAARAAVLGGHVPGWTQRWAGLSETPLTEVLQAARFQAVPERAPLTMEASAIDLCCHRLARRVLHGLGRLFGFSTVQQAAKGSH
ncbi:hypothetical protein SAMN05421644_11147 [Allochromatium warmingii]|uniref:Uncharacterized protein n=1 Tax=Allochromatium warmingii TaxID=61595 RepID=A0A1H3E6P3_ALLWA|nr:hypothetical protein [Allochromatium warmingii]SDX73569.1 hypothetical protein SAMN05421644_11147 [Allochromatium warmingii]